MDPNELMRRLRAAITKFEEADAGGYPLTLIDQMRQITADFHALDDWLRTGGYLPDRWSRAGSGRRP